MKLQDIPMGGRFEYEGRVFVKTGPITATSEEGGQRMIPRHAFLKPLDLPPPQTASGTPRNRLDKAAVLESFNAFHATCSRLITPAAHPELEAARQQFLATLHLSRPSHPADPSLPPTDR